MCFILSFILGKFTKLKKKLVKPWIPAWRKAYLASPHTFLLWHIHGSGSFWDCPCLLQARSPSIRHRSASTAQGSPLTNLLCLSKLLLPPKPVWASLHCTLLLISFCTLHIHLLPQLMSHAVLHSSLGFAYAGFMQLQFNWLQRHYSWG